MRLTPLTPETAQGKARDALADIYERHGSAGPMVRTMAHSPALLRAYLDMSRANKRVKLDRKLSERISIAVQAQVGCDYCLVSHTQAGRQLGVSETELALAREGDSEDPKVAALLRFAVQVYRGPSLIRDEDIERLRELGYTDRDLADTVALVGQNVLTGSFNLVAGLHADPADVEALPRAEVRSAAA